METTSTDFYDEIARTYDDAHKGAYWHFYHELSWKYIQQYLPKDKKNSRILDAGGGTGYWSIALARRGYTIVLSDVSSGMLEVAREKIEREKLEPAITIVKSDLIDMSDFDDGIFDLALAEGNAISYCSYPFLAIGELSRITRRNGFVIASVDNKLTLAKQAAERGDVEEAQRILQTGIAQISTKNGDHFQSYAYSIDELDEIFNKNGLQSVFQIGKPVFAVPQHLDNEEHFDALIDLEMKFSSQRVYANHGGHITMVGQKR